MSQFVDALAAAYFKQFSYFSISYRSVVHRVDRLFHTAVSKFKVWSRGTSHWKRDTEVSIKYQVTAPMMWPQNQQLSLWCWCVRKNSSRDEEANSFVTLVWQLPAIVEWKTQFKFSRQNVDWLCLRFRWWAQPMSWIRREWYLRPGRPCRKTVRRRGRHRADKMVVNKTDKMDLCTTTRPELRSALWTIPAWWPDRAAAMLARVAL